MQLDSYRYTETIKKNSAGEAKMKEVFEELHVKYQKNNRYKLKN